MNGVRRRTIRVTHRDKCMHAAGPASVLVGAAACVPSVVGAARHRRRNGAIDVGAAHITRAGVVANARTEAAPRQRAGRARCVRAQPPSAHAQIIISEQAPARRARVPCASGTCPPAALRLSLGHDVPAGCSLTGRACGRRGLSRGGRRRRDVCAASAAASLCGRGLISVRGARMKPFVRVHYAGRVMGPRAAWRRRRGFRGLHKDSEVARSICRT
jgi:hypothetical protein